MRIVFFGLILLAFSATAQQQQTITQQFGLKLYSGNIVIHTTAVNNVAGAKPKGFELEYTLMRRQGWLNENCDCYSRAGIAFGYFDLDHPILGKLYTLHYFIEPSFRITDRLFFSLKGDLGLSYLTKPYDEVKNPDNRSYAIHVNPYITLGAGPSFRLNDRLTLTTNASFHHISNGGLKEPNRGVNWTTLSAGVRYSNTRSVMSKKVMLQADTVSKRSFVETAIFYVPAQGYSSKYMLKRNYVIGASVQWIKPVSNINGITAGAEIYYNNVSSSVADREKNSAVIAGLQAGNVFLLNRVHFSQQLGVNIVNKTGYLTTLYHRWTVTYKLNKKLAVGFSLKAHTDNADFVDGRLVWKL